MKRLDFAGLHPSLGKYLRRDGRRSDASTVLLCALVHALANQLSIVSLSSALLRREPPANLTPAQVQDCLKIENSVAQSQQIMSRLLGLIETMREYDAPGAEPAHGAGIPSPQPPIG